MHKHKTAKHTLSMQLFNHLSSEVLLRKCVTTFNPNKKKCESPKAYYVLCELH